MRISDWSSDVCSSIFGPCREGRSLDQLRQLLLVERGHLKRLDAADRAPATRERKRRCGRVTAEVACEVHMSAWRREAVGREPPPHRIGRVEPAEDARSDERRGGKECVSPCGSRWSTEHKNTKNKKQNRN